VAILIAAAGGVRSDLNEQNTRSPSSAKAGEGFFGLWNEGHIRHTRGKEEARGNDGDADCPGVHEEDDKSETFGMCDSE